MELKQKELRIVKDVFDEYFINHNILIAENKPINAVYQKIISELYVISEDNKNKLKEVRS